MSFFVFVYLKFLVIFWAKKALDNPIPLQNPLFHICQVATCHSFHMIPRCQKNIDPGVSY